MCHHTRHKYNCGHKITTPLVHCHFHALPSVIHPVTKRDLRVASLCPSCAMSTGQAIVYPWQVDSQAVPVPVQVFTPQAQPRIIYQPQPQYQYQYQTYTPQQTYTAPQLIPGPGSGGTALPVPGGIPQSTRMEWRGGQWCPVTHYHFPSATSTPTSTSSAYVPPPVAVQVAARPPGIPPNQGWSRVHAVDPGPPPPAGPPPGLAPVSSGGVSFGGNVTSFLCACREDILVV
ncbi:hypothetical protein BKA61DRAFT_620127 [Leptodontidium sp. MPI-SDFR-AT-0119]|nr:hypothetical protein BKA61DRAFT_620127 [Leptodontidium sp. MPI-SDFR-AT-0119]